MNFLSSLLIWLYSTLLGLYPQGFRNDFAEEMQNVFRDSVHDALSEGILPLTIICLKEFSGLPLNILHEFLYEIKSKESIMVSREALQIESNNMKSEGYSSALVGTLPFALFGIVSMIDKSKLPFHSAYTYLAFFAIMLIGLLIGTIKHFPRWSYSYLGWSLVFAWWWTDMGTYGLRIFGFRVDFWTWQIWAPLFATLGIALLWTRSLRPFRQLIRGIWQDWTLASFMMYTFIAWMGLIYDENHHPYLLLYMTASTLIISAGAWFFIRNNSKGRQIITLLSGFFLSFLIMLVCDWGWEAYYNPIQIPFSKYFSLQRLTLIFLVWGAILFWPVLLGLAQRAVNKSRTV